MTDHPSQPHHDDDLNTLLDALVSGKRAPDANGASDPDAFAAVHRLVSGDAAAVSAPPSEHTLDTIWRNVMQAHVVAPGAEPGFGPPQSARQRARVRAVPERPRPSRFQTLVSMAAVAAMLIVLIGAAWMGRGGGSPEPSGTERYAAQPLVTGTPDFPASIWFTPVMPEDCVAERMDREEYFDIMRTGPTPAPRAYLPVTPAESDVAIEVATAGRIREACLIYGDMDQWRTLETPSALYARTAGQTDVSPNEAEDIRQLSNHLPIVPFDELFTYTQERMPEELATLMEGTNLAQVETTTYLPDYAYQLADNRIAVATGSIFWANPEDEHFKVWVEEDPDTQATTYGVFASVDGQWLYDQSVTVCVGDCSDVLATPESTGWTAEAPLSPDSWMDPVDWEACTVGPMTSGEYVDILQRDIDTSWRSYEMVGPPVPDDAQSAVETLQQLETCGYVPYDQYDVNRMRSLFTDAYHRESPGQLTIRDAEWSGEYANEPGFKGLQRHFESLPHPAYYVLIEGYQRDIATPTVSLGNAPSRDEIPYIGEAYNPHLAVALSDGRIAIPATYLFRADDMPRDEFLIVLYILAEEENSWLIDEMIYLCVGACLGPATPVASPIATPAWFTPDVQLAVPEGGAVSLRAEPSTQSESVITVHSVTPLMTLGPRERGPDPDADGLPPDGMWVNVRTPGGLAGWIRDIDLEPYVEADSQDTGTPSTTAGT